MRYQVTYGGIGTRHPLSEVLPTKDNPEVGLPEVDSDDQPDRSPLIHSDPLKVSPRLRHF